MIGTGSGAPAGQPGIDLGKRIVAAAIDGAIAAFVTALIPILGGLLAAVYMLLRDGLDVEFMKHQSLGKKLVGLRAVRLDGQPMDMASSVKRNLPLVITFFCGIFAILPTAGSLVAGLICLVGTGFGIGEIVLVVTDPQARRLGDKIARTEVIEVAAPVPSFP